MLKKITVAVALTGLMACAAFAGQKAQTGINGSSHDMNAYGQDDALKRTCVFCHTPHNAVLDSAAAPLWNRADTTFDSGIYTWSAPANAPISISLDVLQGPSRLCMSCHDGSIAYDSHAGQTTGAGTTKLANSRLINDLTVTHPIGFNYAAAVTARPGELVPATATAGYFLDTPSATLLDFNFNTKSRGSLTYSTKLIKNTLTPAGTMTCASCHEVHNTTNAAPETVGAYNYFLNAKEEGSAICLSCHIK